MTLRGVRSAFGAVEAIHDVDLDVDDGEFVVFVGPFGCDKRTLPRMIAVLDSVTAIGGRVVNEMEIAERSTATVLETFAFCLPRKWPGPCPPTCA